MGVASQTTYAYDVVTDSSGNTYTTGYTYGNLDGQTLTGNTDLFVVKHNSSGTKQWTGLLGVASSDTKARRIAVDSSGNVYTTGDTNGNLDGETLTGSFDLFVVKYNSSGTKQWTKLLGVASSITLAKTITCDSSGNIYVAGYTYGNLDAQTKTGSTDLFVVKYNSSGTKQWTKLLGVASANTNAFGISTDSSGNIFVTGYTTGNLDGETLTGSSDLFVVKYDSSGTKQWTKLLGVASANTQAYDIKADSSGNVYTTGVTYGALDGETLTGTRDLFVVKYNSSGTKQWTKLLGVASKTTNAQSIAVDSTDYIYTAGYTNGNLDGETLTGTNDLFVVKYNSSGTKQWTRLLGVASSSTYSYGISTYGSEALSVTGYTTGNLDGETLTGSSDLFIVKYN